MLYPVGPPLARHFSASSLGSISREYGSLDIHGNTKRMEYTIHDKERCPSCGLWKSKVTVCKHCVTRPNRQQVRFSMFRSQTTAAIPTFPTRPLSAGCSSARVPHNQRPSLQQSFDPLVDLGRLNRGRLQHQQPRAHEMTVSYLERADAEYAAAIERARKAVRQAPVSVSTDEEAYEEENDEEVAVEVKKKEPVRLTDLALNAATAREYRTFQTTLDSNLDFDHRAASPGLLPGSDRQGASPTRKQKGKADIRAGQDALRADILMAQPDNPPSLPTSRHAAATAAAMQLAAEMVGQGREREAAIVTALVAAVQDLQFAR